MNAWFLTSRWCIKPGAPRRHVRNRALARVILIARFVGDRKFIFGLRNVQPTSRNSAAYLSTKQDPAKTMMGLITSTPALGLSGWLAHGPDRPREIACNAWTDQLIIWLQEDLNVSLDMASPRVVHATTQVLSPAPGSRAPGRTCSVALNSAVSA